MKYQNHTIEETPTEKYPNMVTITAGAKSYGMKGRRFISLEKAKLAIEEVRGEVVVRRTPKQIQKDLEQTIPLDYSKDWQSPEPLKTFSI